MSPWWGLVAFLTGGAIEAVWLMTAGGVRW